MRILWLCNLVIPQVCEVLGLECSPFGGWMTGLADELDSNEDIELVVCAPMQIGSERLECRWGKKSLFYGFYSVLPNNHEEVKKRFSSILTEVCPDIVHIFGTEYEHSAIMVDVFNNPKRTVIHLQGLISECAKVYSAFLPTNVIKRKTLFDLFFHTDIISGQKEFYRRGEIEKNTLLHVGHVMGRTDWDNLHTLQINPKLTYHYVQELMRKPFYEGEWKYDGCKKHTIFISQGAYPLKGIHFAIGALKKVKEQFPDVQMRVSGPNIISRKTLKGVLCETSYSRYIRKLIRKNGLNDNIAFVGMLSAEGMKNELLRCNVFVSPSCIENSSNSIGEAMMLGVPSIVSDVGGTKSIVDGIAGIDMYEVTDVEDLARKIKNVFDQENKLDCCAITESLSARSRYDEERVVSDLLRAYEKICS